MLLTDYYLKCKKNPPDFTKANKQEKKEKKGWGRRGGSREAFIGSKH